MNLAIIVLLLLFIFGILLFTTALKVRLLFDTDKEDMSMTLLWLKPLIRIEVTIKDMRPELVFYLFNKRVLNKILKASSKKLNKMKLIKLSEPRAININTRYGFRDPYATGIACGAVNMASQFINIDTIKQTPDFMAETDYIYVDATAKVNIGSTLIKMLKMQGSS